MKIDCPFCGETFDVSRLLIYTKYYLHTSDVYRRSDFGKNIYRPTIHCPICKSELGITMHMRIARAYSRDKKNKENVERVIR